MTHKIEIFKTDQCNFFKYLGLAVCECYKVYLDICLFFHKTTKKPLHSKSFFEILVVTSLKAEDLIIVRKSADFPQSKTA